MATVKKLKLSLLIVDQGTDTRHELNIDVVEDYFLVAKKAKFPPLVVYYDKELELYFLADGFHRYYAFHQAGIKEYNCEIRDGTRKDAIKFALTANDKHGLRRSLQDKRRGVEITLMEFPKLSDRALAEMAGVSHPFVATIRKETEAKKPVETVSSFKPEEIKKSSIPQRTVRQGKDGINRAMPQRSKPIERPNKGTTDATNLAVPPEIIPAWDRAMEESNKVLALISDLRTTLKEAQRTNNPTFREVDFSEALPSLDLLFENCKRSRPYAVCFDCNGVMANNVKDGKLSSNKPQHCLECKGRGFISQFYYDHSVSEEAKKVAKR